MTDAITELFSAPLTFNWTLSYRCNFSCSHCYSRDEVGEERPVGVDGEERRGRASSADAAGLGDGDGTRPRALGGDLGGEHQRQPIAQVESPLGRDDDLLQLVGGALAGIGRRGRPANRRIAHEGAHALRE